MARATRDVMPASPASKRKARTPSADQAPSPGQAVFRDGKLASGNPMRMSGHELRMYAARLGLNLHDCRTLGEDALRQSCIQFQTNRINALTAE